MRKNMTVLCDVSRGKNHPLQGALFAPANTPQISPNLTKKVVLYPIDRLTGFQTLNGLEWIVHFSPPIFNLFFGSNPLPCKGLRKSKAQKTARYYNNIYINPFPNPRYLLSKINLKLTWWGWCVRRYVSQMTHTEFMGRVCEVCVGKSGIDGKILKRVLSQLEVMLSNHNKVTLARIDFHQPHYTLDNKHLDSVLRGFKKHIQQAYNVGKVGYCWVREQERAKAQHYHLALIFDGNRIKNPYPLLKHIGEKWAFYTDGTYHIPQTPIYRLMRNDDKAISKAVYRLSYFAKGRGKGYRPPKTRDFSTSQLKFNKRKK